MTANKTCYLIPLAFAVSVLGAGPPSWAADESTPDWPCVQKKVAEFAASQVWDGPSIEGVKGWWEDKEINRLIDRAASRRIADDDIAKDIKAYAEGLPEADRDKKLTLLFAGIFDKVASQRRTVINGIEKYLRGQRERAADIEKMGVEIAKLETEATTNEEAAKKLTEIQEKFDWASRIFQERNQSIPVACEVPVLIDQRLFNLARAVREHMSN